MRFILVPAFILLAVGIPAAESTLDLATALQRSRENALELVQLGAELEFARSDEGRADMPNDTVLFGRFGWAEDRTESSSLFAGDRRNSLSGDVGIRKLFPKATAVEGKISQRRDFTAFPPADPTAGPDGAAFQSFNPSYQTVAEVSVSQPLWRNWLGRELEMQRNLLTADIAPAELNLKLQAQMVQAQIEQYYWNLAEFEAQQALTRKLIVLSQRFADLMRERVRYGRADQVDVADAESVVIAQEGRLLDLIFSAQHYRRRLRIGMNPAAGMPEDVTGPAPIYLPPDILAQGAMAHVVDTPEAAYAYALENRIDLKILQVQQQPLKAELQLTEEQNKPSVNIVGGFGKAGLEGRWDQSVVDVVDDGKHLFYNVGIEAEVNLQKSGLGAQQKATVARMKGLDAQAQLIQASARQEIEFAYSGFESARRKRLQAQRSIKSLEAKRQAEIKKFKQARSEEIVVLSYELEVLAAQSDLIAADKLARDSDVRLRTALHAYPSED